MIHLGDITKLKGSAVPIVDVITGGSPCQNFSVAGNRQGLGGDQSVLFYHQIRLVKEMREHDRHTGRSGMYVRPRYCIWENVPGAFSSNGGKDFQAVLTEFVRVAEPEAPDVPMPDKGRWPKSGLLYDMDGKWSIAWRVHDAQFWGVPQRRKRISLVADFGGGCAGKILFESEGVSGYSAEGFRAWQGAAADAGEGFGETGTFCLNDQGGAVMSVSEDVTGALRAQEHGHQPAVCLDVGFVDAYEELAPTALSRQYKDPPLVNETATHSVRRLTPLECERLQGFPDNWTDIGDWTDSKGKRHKAADSPRYKALGNSIALPFWQFLARRICAQYERDITIASLFDGIGGFPLVFERCGAKAVWASEIEEFPMAVTRERFKEVE